MPGVEHSRRRKSLCKGPEVGEPGLRAEEELAHSAVQLNERVKGPKVETRPQRRRVARQTDGGLERTGVVMCCKEVM